MKTLTFLIVTASFFVIVGAAILQLLEIISNNVFTTKNHNHLPIE